ncbi:regulatory protein RecX [Rathayibacter toxicus]|uniref:Regulatory protein RecX n=1 Tax=Rathayibacter toxicus TaxID=145458 RepID=A0A2S5Y7Z1_9MICO|nr:hypothetical protein APU90_01985 [Rathayibacter toxicus]PPG22312.1 regulatory protein RecX [Rathayibacter toxicus]PPG47147.1 regulatory protein RecX [Rathayibacter toxicus]PPH24332.1 regulatory protein RecX [Rathayibacter toxicus]PPH57884.1 regulatory protein RecX [Rathayibacter toxicus]
MVFLPSADSRVPNSDSVSAVAADRGIDSPMTGFSASAGVTTGTFGTAAISEEAADRIVRSLSRGSLSIAEVEDRLLASSVPEKKAREIVTRFIRIGYLDDFRMAEELVNVLSERKRLGRSFIQHALRARQLDPEAIVAALDGLDGDDEYRRALELAHKRLPSLRSISREIAERRLAGFLTRRGYDGVLVQRVVRESICSPDRVSALADAAADGVPPGT